MTDQIRTLSRRSSRRGKSDARFEARARDRRRISVEIENEKCKYRDSVEALLQGSMFGGACVMVVL